MKLRVLSIFLAVMLVLGMIPGAAATETTEATEETKPIRGEFECGDDLVWAYEEGVLTITGTGEMDDYEGDAPWAEYKDEIESVILTGGVTYIGARAFMDYDELETVDFGDKLKEIGAEAFRSCEGLEEIELPASFKIFGESSFLGCTNLEAIRCSGNFPSFRLNSMWDCYATIYYPVERPWAVSLIEELENAFHGRIEFLASDGTDHYVPTEATTVPAETEAPTEAPTELPTTVPTEVPTEAPTEMTEAATEQTVPETAAAPETQPPVQETEAPTVPAEPQEEGLSNKAVLLSVGIALALSLIVALLMVIRQLGKKGKYTM